MTPSLLMTVLAATPVLPVEETQLGDQAWQAAACDEFGCFVSWSTVQGTFSNLWSRTVTPTGPGEPPLTLQGWSSRAQLWGVATGAGLRLHFFDTRSTGGDTNLYLALATDGGAPNQLGIVAVDAPARYMGHASCGLTGGSFLCAYNVAVGVLDGIRYRRLGADGAFLDDAGATLQTGGNLCGTARVVPVGDDLILGWEDRITAQQYDIYGAVLHPGGVLGPQLFPVSSLTDEEADLVAAPAPGAVLMAWTVSSTPSRIALALVDADAGVSTSPLTFSAARQPALSWHGDRWLVAFQRTVDAGTVVEAHVVFAGGDGGSTPVFASPNEAATSPVAAKVDDGRALLVFRQPDPVAGTSRLMFTFVGLRLLGEPCLEDGWCHLGQCEAGACTAPDAGVAPANPVERRLALGCGCASTSPAEFLGAVVLALMGRRRLRR